MAKRLFIGIKLPARLRARLESAKDILEGEVGGRWIPAENLHLTLKFLGACDESRVAEVERAIDEAINEPPFAVRTTVFGCFPTERQARVFWLGTEATPRFADVYEALNRALDGVGFPPEKKAFHPHITLVRFKRPARIDAAAVNRLVAIEETLPVEEITLFESLLSPAGARYIALFDGKLRG